MNIDSIVSRLQKVDNQLMTISSLRRIQDMSEKRAKPCPCAHHRSTPVLRCPGKCSVKARERKKYRCDCPQRPKLCSCIYGSDDLAMTDHKSKESDIEDDSKRRFEKSSHHEKPKEIIPDQSLQKKPSETKSLDDRELEERNLELEEKLKSMDCSLSCLREEGEKQAACLRDALERAKQEAKLASRSRNLAMDLAKQSRDQTDVIKASRDEIINQTNVVKCNNTKLQCECEDLRCKLKEITDNEEKKCAEVDDEVNRIKCAVKQKEMELTSEKSELERTVGELTSQVKIQKKRICELTSICARQRDLLRENENCISMKIAQLTEAEDKIKTSSCKCRQIQEQMDDLECRLNVETIARENLQKELDERQDNCDCELQIKNKIIADQVETIKKLKKLLQDSEKMAHQAAFEFESLRDELHCLKQSNKSLRIALDEVNAETCDDNEFCDRCNVLEEEIQNLEEQKQRAMMAAKLAAAKLCKTTMDYERQIDYEKSHNYYVNNLVERQEVEIQLLKKEILCVKEFRSQRSKDYIVHQ